MNGLIGGAFIDPWQTLLATLLSAHLYQSEDFNTSMNNGCHPLGCKDLIAVRAL